jgi:hypothetical protein
MPEIMQIFLRNGDACDKIFAEALQVGSSQMQLNDNSSLELHDDILYKLGENFGVRSFPRQCLTAICRTNAQRSKPTRGFGHASD